MSRRLPTNLAASVHQRLLNLSRSKGENYGLLLTRYILERFLYRLSISEHAEKFVLKGAMLFVIWRESPHRPTRDLDLLGYGHSSDQELIPVFKNICGINVESDGLIFDSESIQIEEIREQEEYDGRRIKIDAYLSESPVRMQIDVGFGDAVTPEPCEIDYPTLLEFPTPRIRAYPIQSVVSEKLQTMVALGMVNSRMKDFYDIWIMAQRFDFKGRILAEAIEATFNRRATHIPEETPIALTDEFATDAEKRKQWEAFLNRIGLRESLVDLPQVIDDLRRFILPPLSAAASSLQFDKSWTAGGPWL